MNTYEDKYLRGRVQNVIQNQKRGKILVDVYKSGLGLPARDELGVVLNRASYPHEYEVGAYGYLDYDNESGLYEFIRKTGAELPPILQDYHPLMLAEAVIHRDTRTIEIQAEDMLITFSAVPVWEDDYSLLKQINEELARKNAWVVVWKLSWEEEGSSRSRTSAPAARLRNAHALVHLTGYALDTDLDALVYCGCVGYKTSIESIRATLITQKPLSLNAQTVQPLDRYEAVWQSLPEYTSHQACFVARPALPGKWEPEDRSAYLLVFHGTPDPKAELQRQFIERLGEALEVPVLADWAIPLWEAAVQYQFLSPLKTAGDCVTGAKLTLDADWKALIEQLLRESKIQLN